MDQDFTKMDQDFAKFHRIDQDFEKMDRNFTKFRRLDQDFQKKKKRPRMGPGRLPVQKFGAKTQNLAKSGVHGPIPGPQRAKTEKKS